MSIKKKSLRIYLVICIAVLIIIGASVWMAMSLRGISPDTAGTPEQVIGKVISKEVVSVGETMVTISEVNTSNGTFFVFPSTAFALKINQTYTFTTYPTKNDVGYSGTERWITDSKQEIV
jgi:hypothetical protein